MDKNDTTLDKEQIEALKQRKSSELKGYIGIIMKLQKSGRKAQGRTLKHVLVHMGYEGDRFPTASVEKWFQGRDKININILDFEQCKIDIEKFDEFLRGKINDRWMEICMDFQKESDRFDLMIEDFFYNELLIYFLEIIDIEVPSKAISIRSKFLEEQEQLRKDQARERRSESGKRHPSGLLFEYHKDIFHIHKMKEAIEDGEFEKWEHVVEAVEKYCEEANWNFTEKSIDKGLEEIKKTWLEYK